jgi:methyl-accepting chemotaxis protein
MLKTTVAAIRKTSALVQEISAATQEQSSGSRQLSTAIQELDQVIQQNASASAELAATSEEFSGQAQKLRELISFFKISDSRAKLAARPPAPRPAQRVARRSSQFPRAPRVLHRRAVGHEAPSGESVKGAIVHLGADSEDMDFERH